MTRTTLTTITAALLAAGALLASPALAARTGGCTDHNGSTAWGHITSTADPSRYVAWLSRDPYGRARPDGTRVVLTRAKRPHVAYDGPTTGRVTLRSVGHGTTATVTERFRVSLGPITVLRTSCSYRIGVR